MGAKEAQAVSGIKAVVFDFDGTLTELTLDFHFLRSEVVRIARQYVPESAITALEDRFIIEMIYEIEDGLDGRGADFRKEAFERLRVLEVEASKDKAVYPYTRDVLAQLRRSGVKVGVITRNCLDAILCVFPDMAGYVDATVTRDDLREVKPHPRHVYTISRLLAISPEEGMLAGDHPTDIAAGNAAGMETVGLLTGRTTRLEFELAGATHILSDIREIPGLLRLRGSRT
jgi:phosphoglycolate phosphatase